MRLYTYDGRFGSGVRGGQCVDSVREKRKAKWWPGQKERGGVAGGRLVGALVLSALGKTFPDVVRHGPADARPRLPVGAESQRC